MPLNSIVEFFPDHSGHKCGYCKSPNSNYSYGMWAHTMSVTNYQDLIDRGWRRSGMYCYKPTMDITCCPMYTIRCRALEFKASKSQKKILKRFNKYLMGQEAEHVVEDGGRRMSTCSTGTNEDPPGEGREHFVKSNQEHQNIDINAVMKIEVKDDVPTTAENKSNHPSKLEESSSQATINKEVKKDLGPDPNKPPCVKAKQLRRQRKLEKLKDKGVDITNLMNTSKNQEKQVEDFIHELPNDVRKKLEIKLVRTTPPSPEWLATAKATHEVYVKYQTIIHNDKPDKITEMRFREFLVESPLREEYGESAPVCGYGSFHQQYWLDGKIIAVGVIDILPKCVSSVYFFYDPNYMNLTLGTYGALREIEFTRALHKSCSQIQYYYMGFYIHSCRKMRYKGNFFPSDLLCPETYKWFPLKDCIPKLEASPYSRLDPDLDSIDENCPSDANLNYIPVLRSGTVLFYEQYRRKYNKKVDDSVKRYACLVGKKTALSLILVR